MNIVCIYTKWRQKVMYVTKESKIGDFSKNNKKHLTMTLKISLCAVVLVALLALAGFSAADFTWTESGSNPIFGEGVGGPKAYYPSVLYDASSFSGNGHSALYKMWYGTSGGTTGLATSNDGISWTDQGVVMSNGYHATVEYYPAGFTGVNSGTNPSSLTMYYRMWHWPGLSYSVNDIRYTDSPDGSTWYNDQPCQNGAVPIILNVGGAWNRGSYGPSDILYNPSATNTGANPFDYTFAMYYDGTTGGDESTGLGYSSDGITWTGYDSNSDGTADPVFQGTYVGGDWDRNYATRATIIKNSASDWEMWYSGGDGAMNHGIGYATSSDGISWARDTNNPIFYKDDGVSWRDDRTYCPMVIKQGTTYKMWFTGKDLVNGDYSIGYATGLATESNPPVPTVEVGNPTYVIGSDVYASCATPLWFNATDDVGVVRIRPQVQISTDGGATWTNEFYNWINDNSVDDLDPATGSIVYMRYFLTDGYHRIRMQRAQDAVPNNSPATAWMDYYVDCTPPAVTIEVGDPTYTDGSDVYATCATPLWFNATDDVGVYRLRPHVEIWDGTMWVLEYVAWIYDNDPNDLDPTVGSIEYMRYFLTDCDHRIRIMYAYDNLGNSVQTARSYYKVDCTPGETTKRIGEPNITGGYVVTTSTPIVLNAVDMGTCMSGIQEIRYSIDGAPEVIVPGDTATVYFPSGGVHTISWYCVDNLGHMETSQPPAGPQEHYVDDSPPVPTVEVGNPTYTSGSDVYATCATPLWFNATDDVGVVRIRPQIQISIDGGATWTNEFYGWIYDNSVDDLDPTVGSISYMRYFSTDCYHRIRMQRSQDAMPNNSPATAWMYYYVDCTPGMTLKTIGSPSYDAGYWVTTWTPITLDAMELLGAYCASGIAEIYYQIDGGAWNIVAGDTVTVYFPFEGIHTISWYCVDNIGNVEVMNGPQEHHVDDSPPELDVAVGTPQIEVIPDLEYFVTSDTQIDISATEQRGGAQFTPTYAIYYEILYDGMVYGPFGPFGDTSFTFGDFAWSDDCDHLVTIWAVDDLQNTITLPDILFHVDDTGPATTKDIGDPQYQGGYYVSNDTPFTFTANDYVGPCVSGVQYLYFEIDGVPYMVMDDSFTFTPDDLGLPDGEYTLEFWSEDMLGNEGPSTIQDHIVDSTSPISWKTFDGPTCGDLPQPPGWQLVKTYELIGSYPEHFENDVIDLSAYAGKTVQLAWRYYSDDEYIGAIDDVVILEDGMPMYSENFDSYVDDGNTNPGPYPPGWTEMNYGTACYSYKYWGAESYKYHSSPNSMACYYNCPNDDWIITPWFTFDAGSTYALDYWYLWDDSWDIYMDLYIQVQAEESEGPEGPVWVTSDTWIQFHAKDTGAGASGVEYLEITVMWDSDHNGSVDTITEQRFIKDNNPNDLDPEFGQIAYNLTLDEECYHEISYRAIPYFGIAEEYHLEIDMCDNSAPEVNKTFEGPGEFSDYLFVNLDTVISLEATDLPGPFVDDGEEFLFERQIEFINETFDTWLPAGWSTNTFSQAFTSNAGGTSPEAELYWLDASGADWLMSPVVDTSSAGSLTLEFRDYVDHFSAECYFFVEVYDGSAWVDVTPWSNPVTADRPATLWSIDLTGYTSTDTQIRFSYGYDYWNINWWDIDNVVLYGEGGAGGGEGCASGVVAIEYRIWTEDGGWGNWTLYWDSEGEGTGPFSFAEGCTHYLQYRAIDCLGNTLLCEEDLMEEEERETQLLLEEGFEDVTFPPSGWDQTIYNSAATFERYTGLSKDRGDSREGFKGLVDPKEPQGSWCACVWWDYYEQDEWLFTTVPVDLAGYEEAYLKFYTYNYDSVSYVEHDYVKISTNGGSTWTTLGDMASDYPNHFWGSEIVYDLDSYIGDSVVIGFHRVTPDGGSGAWGIDHVRIEVETEGNGNGNGDDNETEPLPITVYNQTHYVDLEPPESWMTLELDHDGNMITPYTEFTIWQEDFACGLPGGSECCMIHYRIDGVPGQTFYYEQEWPYPPTDGKWRVGEAGSDTPVSFQIRDPQGFIKAGKYIVEFYAEDCLGNIEPIIHRHIYYPDTESPLTTLLFSGPRYEDQQDTWITEDTKVTLKSSDPESGVSIIKYMVDDGVERTYTAPFTIAGEGWHTIQYYAIDHTGTTEDVHTLEVRVDSSGPDSAVSFMGETYETSSVTWITSGTTLCVDSSDGGCGLATVYYRTNEGSWQEYQGAVSLASSGVVEFYAVDNLGNTGGTGEVSVGIDASAPVVSYKSPQASHLYIAGREIMVLPQSMDVDAVVIGPTTVSAAASDTGVGIESLCLYIDGELRQSSSTGSLEFVWNQRSFLKHKLEIVSTDFFGHSSSKILHLWVFNL